jgi:hypothetical protein
MAGAPAADGACTKPLDQLSPAKIDDVTPAKIDEGVHLGRAIAAIEKERDEKYELIDRQLRDLDAKREALTTQRSADAEAADKKLAPLLKRRQWYAAADTLTAMVAKVGKEPQTVFLLDMDANMLELDEHCLFRPSEQDKPQEDEKAHAARLSEQKAPACFIRALAQVNALFRYCPDVRVRDRYDATASCCEGEFDDTLQVDFGGTEVGWAELPAACLLFARDTTTACAPSPGLADARRLFDKGMFGGCGLDRLEASKHVESETIVVIAPRDSPQEPSVPSEQG